MTQEPEMVEVRTCQVWDLAEIYKANLEAHGIPVLLKYESLGLVYGITVDGLGQVRILVPAAYAEDAAIVLKDIVDLTAEECEEQDEDMGPGEEEP